MLRSLLNVTLIVGMSVFASAVFADEGVVEKIIAVGINDAYIPSGFASDTEAYVVVNGLFPNSCYSLTESKVDHVSSHQHEVRTMATVKQSICLRVLVPFTKEISLGKLNTGRHTVRFVAEDGTSFEKSMSVE